MPTRRGTLGPNRMSSPQSGAVQRRQRAADVRKRDNVGRHVGKKSSKELRRADHGLEGQEELAAANLQALLNARQSDYRMVIHPSVHLAAGGSTSANADGRIGGYAAAQDAAAQRRGKMSSKSFKQPQHKFR